MAFPPFSLWLFFSFLAGEVFGSSVAINRCSHSLAYHDLCPNPMFVSSHGSVPDADMKINLTRQHNSTCEFFKNDDEVTVVGGIHVTDEPWGFNRAASSCNHIVKLVLDRNTYISDNEKVCKKEFGMKVHESVYFWHNFSLSATQFTYDDLISNYGHSPSDLKCSHNAKYALMLFLTSRHSKCSLLVQQYRVDDHGGGCKYLKNPYQHNYRFCGAYPCAQASSILHELKLASRRNPAMTYNPTLTHPPQQKSPNEEHQRAGPEITNKVFVPLPMPTTQDPLALDDTLGQERPVDWTEMSFRLSFPMGGVVFIILLLCILRGRYASDMCRNQNQQSSRYHGSTISMEKQGLSF